jgi:hypothetical protein
MRAVKVCAAQFDAAFVSTGSEKADGIVIATTASLKWMLGWPDVKARGAIKRNGWTAAISREVGLIERCTEKMPPVEPFGERNCHCGRIGPFGYGVRLLEGKEGQWFCREHRPMRANANASSQMAPNGGTASDAANCGAMS